MKGTINFATAVPANIQSTGTPLENSLEAWDNTLSAMVSQIRQMRADLAAAHAVANASSLQNQNGSIQPTPTPAAPAFSMPGLRTTPEQAANFILNKQGA